MSGWLVCAGPVVGCGPSARQLVGLLMIGCAACRKGQGLRRCDGSAMSRARKKRAPCFTGAGDMSRSTGRPDPVSESLRAFLLRAGFQMGVPGSCGSKFLIRLPLVWSARSGVLEPHQSLVEQGQSFRIVSGQRGVERGEIPRDRELIEIAMRLDGVDRLDLLDDVG